MRNNNHLMSSHRRQCMLIAIVLIACFSNALGFTRALLPCKSTARTFSANDGHFSLKAVEMTESSNDEQKRKELLEKASQLRREALELEAALRKNDKAPSLPSAMDTVPFYKDMKDSSWSISYRFSDKPEPRDHESSTTSRAFYSGKVTLKFRSDGFTDFISHEPAKPSEALQMIKVWGWDLERSSDDDKDYVLFSIDAQTPRDSSKIRFYFQVRQDMSLDGSISLNEGTVTIKQDIVESRRTPGMWGMFSPKGILAEFRYVGDFLAKPTSITRTTDV